MPPAKKSAPTAKKAATVATPAKKAAAPKQAAAPVKKAAAPAKKSAAVKAAPQVTVTLKQMAAELAEGHELPKKVAEAVLADLVTMATKHLTQGDKIRLTGLGILEVRAREARRDATRRPARPSGSRRARRSPSGQRKS